MKRFIYLLPLICALFMVNTINGQQQFKKDLFDYQKINVNGPNLKSNNIKWKAEKGTLNDAMKSVNEQRAKGEKKEKEKQVYWEEANNRISHYIFQPSEVKNIYDNNSLLYSHVMAYETYLKEIGVNSATSSLLTFEQYMDLRNNLGNPEWIYNSSYWFASVAGEDYVWCIPNDGVFRGGYYMNDDNGGIRPVVTISINEIK